MFRKPREALSPTTEAPTKPSTGRAPTPPNGERPRPHPTMSTISSTKPLTPRPNSKTNAPAPKSSTKKIPASKIGTKPNSSILSFFKKVDSPLKDDSIFVASSRQAHVALRSKVSDENLDDLYKDENDLRFNEVMGSNKKRKLSTDTISDANDTSRCSPTPATGMVGNDEDASIAQPATSKRVTRSGFVAESDSEDEDDVPMEDSPDTALSEPTVPQKFSENTDSDSELSDPPSESDEETPFPRVRRKVPIDKAQAKWEAMQPKKTAKSRPPRQASPESDYGDKKKSKKKSRKSKKATKSSKSSTSGHNTPADVPEAVDSKSVLFVAHSSESDVHSTSDVLPRIPTLKQEATSINEWGQFDGLDEFEDDEYDEGEEFVERKWMEEQARLEAAEEALLEEPFEGFQDEPTAEDMAKSADPAACPICSASLAGISDDLASRHVNGCLDGNPVPLPPPDAKIKLETPTEEKDVKYIPQGGSNRFARFNKSAIARPGQVNPINIGGGSSTGKVTAFSEIMSGKAEDAAWAAAAAAENAARGKPAYQRTCPFYKIMPGMFICVDAFRYGAVKGCHGYFLSHFHSDHYIGLTSSWCHGPIYCSKITANLVKQQLRVDPKWVVPLEFDVKSEVPNTQGVFITMISANHCPGSSLFLFEKVVGKGSNPKVHRILHCGDFRACPAHIAHPNLMPDVIDALSGKVKQQKIDVCYLDTTYLNPKYAFPSQEEVIKACADMCLSLRKDKADESDAWEVVKKQRAGAGMNNFLQASIKPEDDSIAMAIGDTKSRGRLLVICGTYSIGKERICMGIARALDCKIWAPPGKMRICAALEDPELMSRMTDDPKEAQIHMQMLMEIRAETLQEYLNSYKPHFSRIVGFRPSGWSYKPPVSRFTDSPSVATILNSNNWKSAYHMSELVPQRGSTREASCFAVPYSEHSSFRELTLFVCSLRIEKVVPTVNVGSAVSRTKMKAWIEKWLAERRKSGVVRIGDGEGQVKW